jgi:hypothetical protein
MNAGSSFVLLLLLLLLLLLWTGIAQSVQRLATGWTALGVNQPPVQWVPGLFPVVRRPRCGVDHPPSPSAKVKERVELYLYSPSGPSRPVLG